ncbi:hypothetical protein E3N88_43143 [Mikania micrantha]|uniref:Uncharacterized protein n=1 Tax=Mikania micrantha TaxID=192012 RepID=A0A5N6LFR8_9ASTR|nr:hypothetical protein E3N88_43143 [Mikania micrantha]
MSFLLPAKVLSEAAPLRRTEADDVRGLSQFLSEVVQLAVVLNGDHFLSSFPDEMGKKISMKEAHTYVKEDVKIGANHKINQLIWKKKSDLRRRERQLEEEIRSANRQINNRLLYHYRMQELNYQLLEGKSIAKLQETMKQPTYLEGEDRLREAIKFKVEAVKN